MIIGAIGLPLDRTLMDGASWVNFADMCYLRLEPSLKKTQAAFISTGRTNPTWQCHRAIVYLDGKPNRFQLWFQSNSPITMCQMSQNIFRSELQTVLLTCDFVHVGNGALPTVTSIGWLCYIAWVELCWKPMWHLRYFQAICTFGGPGVFFFFSTFWNNFS